MPGQQAKYSSVEKLEGLLRKMCGEGVGTPLTSLRAKWSSLDTMIESQEEVIKGQVCLITIQYVVWLLGFSPDYLDS